MPALASASAAALIGKFARIKKIEPTIKRGIVYTIPSLIA